MRIALIVIFVVAAGVLITVIAASEAISVAAAFMKNDCCGNCPFFGQKLESPEEQTSDKGENKR